MSLPESTTIVPHSFDSAWLEYFNPSQAVRAVAAHIKSLPSSRTPEEHTRRVYEAGLKYFLAWSDDALPTEDHMTEFISHLKSKNLKSSTISSKYLAPTRLYLQKLAGQHIAVSGPERDFVMDCREHIRQAAAVKTPRQDETSNLSALYRHGQRLTLRQVNATLRQVDTTTKKGARDYALLLVAFESALRLAELHRLTPASFVQEGDIVLVKVRGKRSNIDPVPVSTKCYQAVLRYIETYNADLDSDDPRRITDQALWQPLIHGDNYAHIGVNGYNPTRGLSQQGIRGVIAQRTEAATGIALAPHDTRRTAAAIGHKAGMAINAIQKLLRHKDAGVTMAYIGEEPDWHKVSLSSCVSFG